MESAETFSLTSVNQGSEMLAFIYTNCKSGVKGVLEAAPAPLGAHVSAALCCAGGTFICHWSRPGSSGTFALAAMTIVQPVSF